MTNLEQLKKEALDDFHKTFKFSVDKLVGQEQIGFLDTLIDHIHAETVRECVGVMPPANAPEAYADNMTEAEHGWDNCRTEAISRLQALLP